MRFIPLERRGGAPVECYIFHAGATALATWTSSDVARTLIIPDEIDPIGGSDPVQCFPVPITHERVEATDERSGTGLRVSLPRDDADTNGIVDLFRAGEPERPIELSLYRVHHGSADVRRIFYGDVTDAAFATGLCTLNVEPKHGALTRTVMRQHYQAPCNNMLYDAFCGVNKAAFAVAATVDAIGADGRTLTVAAAAGFADGYFGAAGLLEVGGRIGMIDSHVGDQLTLVRAVPGLVAGSDVTIYPGCKRDITDCAGKFDNAVQHMGFPFIPSLDPFKAGVQS